MLERNKIYPNEDYGHSNHNLFLVCNSNLALYRRISTVNSTKMEKISKVNATKLEKMSKANDSPAIYMSREEARNSRVYKYLNRPVFREITKISDEDHLDLFLHLETWEAPQHFQGVLTYKFAKYDSQNRPVWILTFGTYPAKDIIDSGDEVQLEHYVWQCAHWIAKSIVAKTPEENPSQQAVVIFNGKGASAANFLNARTLGFLFKMTRKSAKSTLYLLGLGVGVNVNKVGVFVLNLLRPVLGATLKKVELFGKDESTWRPRLEEVFEGDEIPSFKGMGRGFYRIVQKSPSGE
ncbi:unnamed protein product [Allacma fusca]|uniref:CRAL-TRIO domain-containing protein n=1 Tax=Allacma fusca TaxID=39272 RepID=A0A8J2NWA1_9HEXA|nr:unnamed protein product [Allacma fusca]